MKWIDKIKNFVVVGDTHGLPGKIEKFCDDYDVTNNALIILGDAGFNFYLNKIDRKLKEYVQGLGCLIYCVRGNHEERPENLPDILEDYDDVVDGYIYYEKQYPNIRYLKDGNVYNMSGYYCLVIGGAYSVDKYYRLARAKAKGIDIETQWTGWFMDEQLSFTEMLHIEADIKDITVDFVLTHTCPFSWEPLDLFLRQVDQSTVDNSMEKWLDNIKDEIHWNCAWLFGHFHDDRIVRPHVEMYMNNLESLDNIAERWKYWDNGYKLDWWLKLDPCWPFWKDEMDKRVSKVNKTDYYEAIWTINDTAEKRIDLEADECDYDDNDERAEWD